MRDTSLRLPPGVAGTIVEVRVFSRRGVDKDERAMAIERAEIERLAKDRDDERNILERSFAARSRSCCSARRRRRPEGHEVAASRSPRTCSPSITTGQWRQITVRDEPAWSTSRR